MVLVAAGRAHRRAGHPQLRVGAALLAGLLVGARTSEANAALPDILAAHGRQTLTGEDLAVALRDSMSDARQWGDLANAIMVYDLLRQWWPEFRRWVPAPGGMAKEDRSTSAIELAWTLLTKEWGLDPARRRR